MEDNLFLTIEPIQTQVVRKVLNLRYKIYIQTTGLKKVTHKFSFHSEKRGEKVTQPPQSGLI